MPWGVLVVLLTGVSSRTFDLVYKLDEEDWQPRGWLELTKVNSQFVGKIQNEPPETLRQTLKGGQAPTYTLGIRQGQQLLCFTSIPKMLMKTDGFIDILEVSVSPEGLPFGVSLKVRPDLGATLFDLSLALVQAPQLLPGRPFISQVQLQQERDAKLNPGATPQAEQSFLQKYWWMILLGMIAMNLVQGLQEQEGESPAPAKKE